MIKCKICSFETDGELKLSKHIQHTHKLTKSNYLIQTQHNGVNPICGCGCGENTRYDPGKLCFSKFIHGHQSRLKGHWGNLKSEKRVNGIKNTRKAKFASGEYDYILKSIKDRDNIELGRKISIGSKGVTKPKPKDFGIGRTHSQETKDKMSLTAINNIVKTDRNHTSKLEKIFANILDLLDINYKKFLYAKDIKAFYDFYIPSKNIIIEVDGDFWHCNPDSKFANPKYESQKKNIIRDKEKEKWAKDNGYKLLRFWETDINNNIKEVKRILLENIN